MSARRPKKGLLTLSADAERPADQGLDAARRQLLADWCRLVGQRLHPTPADPRAPADPNGRHAGAGSSDASTTGAVSPTAPPTVQGVIQELCLPPRMTQVLTGLLAGASEKQLANRLSLSPHTVHAHVKQLHKRLNVSSRGELLARFVGTA